MRIDYVRMQQRKMLLLCVLLAACNVLFTMEEQEVVWSMNVSFDIVDE